MLVIHRPGITEQLDAKLISSLNPKKSTLILLRGKNFTRLNELNDVGNAFPLIPLINSFLWFFDVISGGQNDIPKLIHFSF